MKVNLHKKLIYSTLLVVVLYTIAYFSLPRPFQNKVQVTHFWTKKTFFADDIKILFCGDSRIYRGINPIAFSEQYGAEFNVYNFGYSSAGFSNEYLTFLNSKATKENSIFILGITPHSFTPDGLKNEDLLAYLKTPKTEIYQDKYFGSILEKIDPYQIKEVINYYAGNEVKERYFQFYEPYGWIKSYRIPENKELAVKSYLKVFKNNRVDSDAIKIFLQWVYQHHKAGNAIVAFRPPSSSAIEAIEDSLSGMKYSEFISKFEQAGGIWLNFTSEGYHSYDGSHLHYESAIQFSKNLADSVKIRLSLELIFNSLH